MKYVFALMLLCGVVYGDEKVPYEPLSPVIFPLDVSESVEPVLPVPVSVVRPDRIYVVRTNAAQIFRQVPSNGTLHFEDLRESLPDGADKQAPLILRGIFADSDGTPSTRIFTEKYVYLVNGIKPGTVELLVIPKGVVNESDITQQTLTVMGLGPQPPPDDDPKPKPDPKPEPPTPKVEKISIAVVEDTLHRTLETGQVLSSLAYWSGLVDAGHDWRYYDLATKEPKGREAILEAGDLPPPSIIIRNKADGKVVHKGPLPKTLDDLKKLVATLTGGTP